MSRRITNVKSKYFELMKRLSQKEWELVNSLGEFRKLQNDIRWEIIRVDENGLTDEELDEALKKHLDKLSENV